MRAAIFAYSRQGCQTARRVADCFPQDAVSLFTAERLAGEGFAALPKSAQRFYGDWFARTELMVFVGSCGIAVREIAPHVKSKTADPAVLVVDELGRYVIPLLSGHIGGANRMARRVAACLGSEAVITTATDLNRRFSVDAWAAEHGFLLSDMQLAKAVSAAILEGDVPLCSDLSLPSVLPNGLVPGDTGALGIYLGWQTKLPFQRTLQLIPRTLHVGLGCRRGTSEAAIRTAVEAVLQQYDIDRRAIVSAASVDLKAAEPGLLAFCARQGWPVFFYSAQQLQTVAGCVSKSEFVAQVTGVDNVCERSALMGAETLLVPKTVCGGVTVAVAAEAVEVRFE